ncbi:MAG: DUF1553 domain-containing protein [Planctomycetota bacterium]|nr:MAG: DUF1553 domain-containing protein [Planctomycetota bacterium]
MSINRRSILIAAIALTAIQPLAADDAPDFAREVRPILAKNCFKCHGPDDETREAGFRIDLAESVRTEADSGAVPITPGDPAASEVIRRIFADDPAERMPPADSNLQLTENEQHTIRRWVAAGAEYSPHWAFVRPVRPEIPPVADENWPRNQIDHFILARLEQEGLAPSPPADRYTLIRRVSLDLIGLPPTPEEVDAFVNDQTEGAYQRLVDRLLRSPHYGERWARRWLDLARYADTNGYEKDRPRSIWPYRDWVIDALNDDMPFDRFTIEQLAGDMLPGATVEQRIATGFHRNTMLNEEGGIDPLEFRFHAMTDRVATTGTTWLGLTLGCAQCHTHKYDPISHREYYQLMAFRDNADEPELDLPDPALEEQYQQQLEQADQLLAGLGSTIDDPRPENERRREAVDREFAAWLEQQREQTVDWTPLTPVAMSSNLPLLTLEEDNAVFVSGDTTKLDTYQLTYRPELEGITAVRLEALPDDRLPAHGPGMTYYEGTKGDFFLGEFELTADGTPVVIADASESYAENRFGANPVSAALCTDGNVQTGWSVHGRIGERHTAVFLLQEPLGKCDELKLKMIFGRHFASSLGKFRLSATTDPRRAQARDLTEEVESLLALPDGDLDEAQLQTLRTAFLLQAPELAEQTQQIRHLRKRPAAVTTLVMLERPPENPRPTHIHHRGEFLQPTEPVVPAVPGFLADDDAASVKTRLDFARWIVSSDNPLTARVAVNRQWAAFFGRGIVGTQEDFGIQGDPPTHPQLLDWLAVELMEDGWSMKRLHKLIVMSAAYRQSSIVSPEHLEADPGNRLLGRAPRIRLEAEVLRDSILTASGLLSPKIGGPSVYPPQPASVTSEGTYGALPWTASEGEDRYRRSLYTFSKRTAPFAMYATFDGPSGEACVARRDKSNTPLQALTLLNDQMFIEASQALGREFAMAGGPVEDRMTRLFRRCLTRPPGAEEVADLTQFFESQLTRFESGELDAAVVSGEGEADPTTRAAWTVTARILLNLDEMVMRP